MTLERYTADGLSRPPAYSHAVAVSAGRTVYSAGAVPLAADGSLVGPGDVRAQAQQVIENLAVALDAAGVTLVDVAKTTVYVVGGRDELAAAWDVVRDSDLAGAASTLVGVAVLGYAGQLVEIEAVAAV